MEITAVIHSALTFVIVLLISIVGWFVKKQITTIENRIAKLIDDFNKHLAESTREAAARFDKLSVQFHKRSLLDERKAETDRRIQRLEDKLNGKT